MAAVAVDTVIIGGGPSGLLAGIAAGRSGVRVLLLERNESPGRKLLLTGGGRCNVTHWGPTEDLVANLSGNGRFLYPALAAFSNAGLLRLLSEAGVESAVEADGRVFPRSNRARDVLGALLSLLGKAEAEIRTNSRVISLEPTPGSFRLRTDGGGTIEAAKVIIATGGVSYPATGSVGDGLAWAKRLGHRIIPPLPALVGLLTEEEWSRGIPGVSLRGAAVRLSGVKRPEEGDVLFTHFGVSGPAVLNLSRYAVAALAAGAEKPVLSITTDPAASLAQWESRVEQAALANPHRNLAGLLAAWWPKALAVAVLGDDAGREGAHLPRELRRKAAGLLHRLELTVTGSRPIAEALVTQGGVDTREVDPRTLQSRIVPGLYFAGEVLDVDGRTGGYNLQAAFSSGYLAGQASAR